jgi:ribonuclease HI
MRAIEIASQHNWQNLWIESDSTLVINAIKNPGKPVAWQLRNRWNNAMLLFRQMNGVTTHIYREGNQVADSLANHGLSTDSIAFWNETPVFINDFVNRNKLGLPSFRLSST